MEHLPGFAPLAERFDGFILDLWGVIHDGVKPYPGAADCLARLQAAGKRTVLLSNAPRRSAAAQAGMQAMGIPASLYGSILTSGEACRHALADPPDSWFAALGRRVFHLGPERDRNVLEELELERVTAPAEAEFVLNTGPDDLGDPTDLADFEAVLRDCAKRDLPMLCANPDFEVIRGGVRVLCAGALAARYEAMGGDVRSIGKPDPAIYSPVLQLLETPPSRVLAVGDALRTDIAGAAAVSLASCWVTGGIHGADVDFEPTTGRYDRAAAERVARAAGLAPLACIPGFTW